MRLRGPREVLNELRWRDASLAEAEIWFVHRGAPGDERVVAGKDVARLASWYLVLRDERGDTTIPYHRVFRIARAGEILWERRGQGKG